MTERLTQGWRWWIDGLVDAVLLAEDRIRRRRPVRFVRGAGGAVVEHAGGRLGRHPLRSGPDGPTPRRLARALTGRVVDLVVPAEEFLTRRLGPLPPESRPYVEGIVAHQLERMTPWLAADTLSLHRIDPVGPDDPRLMVTVEATARSLNADLVEAIAATRPKELRLVRPADGERREVVLRLGGGDPAAERGRIARVIQGALAAIAAVAIFGGWWLASAAAETEAQATEIAARIDDYQRRLSPATGPVATDRDAIAKLSRDTPMAVISLENLSAALPDDTHLTGLQIARERLRMTGITRDIGSLTTAVEATALFAEPVFSAPTVRLKQGDRFTLDFVVAGTRRTRR